MADFHQFVTVFSMEFINIGPVYTKGWVEGHGEGWMVTKAWTKKQDDTNSRI